MRRPELSYANVMSSIAVFLALGGTSYAVAKNSIGEKHLKPSAVTSPKIKDGAVTTADLAPGTMLSGPRGPRGEQGPAGQTGATGARGPSTIKLWRRDGDAQLPLAAQQGTMVMTAQLPPGNWLLEASTLAEYWPAGGSDAEWLVCQLQSGATDLGLDAAVVGNATGAQHTARMHITRSFNVTAPTSVGLRCWHHETVTAGSDIKVRFTTLKATQAAEIDVQQVTG